MSRVRWVRRVVVSVGVRSVALSLVEIREANVALKVAREKVR